MGTVLIIFGSHASASEHRLRLFNSPCDAWGRPVLRRRRFDRSGPRQGPGHDNLPRKYHPAREPGCDQEDQGLGRVRTNGRPPDEGAGASARPPSGRHRRIAQRRRRPDHRTGRSPDLLARGLLEQTYDVLPSSSPRLSATRVRPGPSRRTTSRPTFSMWWGNQFILGHELGHAVIHQLNLPLTWPRWMVLRPDSARGSAAASGRQGKTFCRCGKLWKMADGTSLQHLPACRPQCPRRTDVKPRSTLRKNASFFLLKLDP